MNQRALEVMQPRSTVDFGDVYRDKGKLRILAAGGSVAGQDDSANFIVGCPQSHRRMASLTNQRKSLMLPRRRRRHHRNPPNLRRHGRYQQIATIGRSVPLLATPAVGFRNRTLQRRSHRMGSVAATTNPSTRPQTPRPKHISGPLPFDGEG